MLFLITLATTLAMGASQLCGNGPPYPGSCNTCLQQPNCGWCVATQQCLQGNPNQPMGDFHCFGKEQWLFGNPQKRCPTCGAKKDCRSCTLGNPDCYWCADDGKCHENGEDSPCVSPESQQHSCDCGIYPTCSICTTLSDGACTWCKNTNTCSSVNTPGCEAAQDCPCGDNANCETCLNDFYGEKELSCRWCATTEECVDSSHPCQLKAKTCPKNCDQYSGIAAGAGCRPCADSGCVWCDSTQKCEEPAVSECIHPLVCPAEHCGQFKDCGECTDQGPNGCSWCFNPAHNNGTCVHANTPAGQQCNFVKTSCEKLCHKHTDCGSCSKAAGCGWCKYGDQKSCVDVEKLAVPCQFEYICSSPQGNGTGDFFLGMFVMFLILGVLLGGFVFYRKRQGKNIAIS